MPLSDGGTVARVLPSQTLSGTGRLTFDTTGMGSLGLYVIGTAVMTVRFIGTSGDPTTATTKARPWKSGASLGTNVFAYDSGAYGQVSTEYRLPGGRKYFVVECTTWTSGSLTFLLYQMPSGSIAYTAGGQQTLNEEETMAGQVFNAATSFVATAANRFLNAVFENPVGSGKLAIITMRRFSSSVNNTFVGISNPTVASFENATAPTIIASNNLRGGTLAIPAATSAMKVSYNMSATRIDAATPVANPAGDFLEAFRKFELGPEYVRVQPPGSRFGHAIGGTGGGLGGAAANNSIYFKWSERDIY